MSPSCTAFKVLLVLPFDGSGKSVYRISLLAAVIANGLG